MQDISFGPGLFIHVSGNGEEMPAGLPEHLWYPDKEGECMAKKEPSGCGYRNYDQIHSPLF